MEKKKSLFKRWWFWVLVVVVIGAIGSMGGDKDKPKETSSIEQPESGTEAQNGEKEEIEEEELYKVGDAFETGDLGVTIVEVEEKKEFKSDNQFIKDVVTEGKFIAVTAKLTNNDTKARTFSAMQFKIIDDKDREFETLTSGELMMILGDDDLFLESCNPGMSRTGVFVFEVPEDTESYSLKVYSGTGFAAKTSVTVKLK